MRMPDKNLDGKKSLFRASQSLGSISSLFSASSKKKSPGLSHPSTTKHSESSKSAEMLSTKKNLHSDTSEDSDDDDEETTEISKSEDNVSPFIAKRYLK